jgi:hypothetical protein
MAVEDKRISTRTVVTSGQGLIQILIEYFPDDNINISFFVSAFNQTIEGISFLNGDLGYIYDNLTDLFEINTDGDLIVQSINSDKYNINDQGDLIYTL